MKSLPGATFVVSTCLASIPWVNSFVANRLSFLTLPPFRQVSAHQLEKAVATPRARAPKLSMQSRETETENVYESVDESQIHVSLASDYRVDITSSRNSETWSLSLITELVKDNELPEGAKSNRALQLKNMGVVPTTTLQCSRSGLNLEVTCTYVDSQVVAPELVATLSRIMVQRLASHEQDTVKKWKISLPNDELVETKNLCTALGVLTLFEPRTNVAEVELVEMVDKNGTPLGMVPRPLVHTFNLLHRGIGMLVTKDATIDAQTIEFPDLYVHRRTDDKRIFPSLYDMFVGGISSAGEDARTTATREVAEELGLSRALTDAAALSEPLFDCTVCTAYNRCVVTVFSFEFDSSQDNISWQEEEVAWGSFVPYSIVESSARLCIERMMSSGSWPGEYPFALTMEDHSSNSSEDAYEINKDRITWDYVPDGLLVWEAWLKWKGR